MNDVAKIQILSQRIKLLREHLENVGPYPGFEEALVEAEAELRLVEQRKQPQS
jgi:hypothetical protein